MTTLTARPLRELYQHTSKHSNYQVLSPALAPLLSNEAISVQSRSEAERLAYIVSRLPVAGLLMADIGGNTGYFSFELLAQGAQHVDYFEGNQAHHDFVKAAASALGWSPRLQTHHRYVNFAPGELAPTDITLLLNVLHHLGDDFGNPATAKEAAKQQMLDCLATLSRSSARAVFQLGFNWQGKIDQPLFAGGSKAEMIEFVRAGTASDWDIEHIGIAERDTTGIVFRDLSAHNLARNDSLGEFLNRPLFILQSRHVQGTRAGQSAV